MYVCVCIYIYFSAETPPQCFDFYTCYLTPTVEEPSADDGNDGVPAATIPAPPFASPSPSPRCPPLILCVAALISCFACITLNRGSINPICPFHIPR